MKRQGMRPDLVAYNAVISACGNSRKLERAQQLLKELRLQALLPDTITYNSLISSCQNGDQPVLAFVHFAAMSQ